MVCFRISPAREILSGGYHLTREDHGWSQHRRKAAPQDGRIGLKIAGKDVDIRVSTVPTQFGEADRNASPR
jgi:hypothetical protein